MEECAREGNRALAKFLGVSLRTACRYAKRMRLETGTVQKVTRRVYCVESGKYTITHVNRWWPSLVQRFLAVEQMKKDGKRNGPEGP